jgi:hypothetical protein
MGQMKPYLLQGTLSADMFYNLANRIERNEVDFFDDEYVMLCSNNVLQRLNRVDYGKIQM